MFAGWRLRQPPSFEPQVRVIYSDGLVRDYPYREAMARIALGMRLDAAVHAVFEVALCDEPVKAHRRLTD